VGGMSSRAAGVGSSGAGAALRPAPRWSATRCGIAVDLLTPVPTLSLCAPRVGIFGEPAGVSAHTCCWCGEFRRLGRRCVPHLRLVAWVWGVRARGRRCVPHLRLVAWVWGVRARGRRCVPHLRLVAWGWGVRVGKGRIAPHPAWAGGCGHRAARRDGRGHDVGLSQGERLGMGVALVGLGLRVSGQVSPAAARLDRPRCQPGRCGGWIRWIRTFA
jgi:hypothetical protein